MLAGLNHCEGDACIILDADLQDPPSLIPEIIYAWLEGYQVVNAVRHDRSSDSLLKRLSSEGFYAIFLKLSKYHRVVHVYGNNHRLAFHFLVSIINHT